MQTLNHVIIPQTLLKNNDSLVVEMKKEEFFNFLSLISAFRDVIIGEDQITLTENLNSEDLTPDIKTDAEKSEYFNVEPEIKEKAFENKETNELNPEEWDPW